MKAFNQTKNEIIATHVDKASTILQRMIGLLGRNEIKPGYGLWIDPCRSIHTFFMQFTIDVVFLSPSLEVVKVISEMKPFRVSPIVATSKSVLELPAHTLKNSNTSIGDQFLFEP